LYVTIIRSITITVRACERFFGSLAYGYVKDPVEPQNKKERCIPKILRNPEAYLLRRSAPGLLRMTQWRVVYPPEADIKNNLLKSSALTNVSSISAKVREEHFPPYHPAPPQAEKHHSHAPLSS
jgi:hypothetical protein